MDEQRWIDTFGRTNAWAPIPTSPFPVKDFYGNVAAVAVGILDDGRPGDAGTLNNWYCGIESENGDPLVPDVRPCLPPSTPRFTDLGFASGLTEDGQIWQWVDYEPQQAPWCPTDKHYRLHAGDSERTIGLATDNTVCAGQWDNLLDKPLLLDAFPSDLEIVEVATGGIGVCALDVDGSITCLGPEYPYLGFVDPMRFDHPPYLDIAASGYHTCAVRQDWTIECNDGSTHTFGPIRDLAVASWHGFDPNTGDQLYYAGPRAGLNLCVITEDNAIRCAGDRYFDDILAQLPTGDAP